MWHRVVVHIRLMAKDGISYFFFGKIVKHSFPFLHILIKNFSIFVVLTVIDYFNLTLKAINSFKAMYSIYGKEVVIVLSII